jgi:exonuclease III
MHHTIAFYNVENLYDSGIDKSKTSIEFPFQGSRSWNMSRYRNKLVKIAKTISSIGVEETQKLPTFFGLCEIENKKVIDELLEEFPFKANYGYVHKDSLDERGIDTAFFYNKEFLTIEESEFIRTPIFNNDGTRDYTRDITYTKGKLEDITIHFFVLHLPSKRENNINVSKRIYILRELRKKLNDIFDKDIFANIIIMGDFNEDPTTTYLYQQLWNKKTVQELKERELFNPFESLYKNNIYSTFHQGRGMLFDQIIFSKSFFKENNKLRYSSSHVFNVPFLQNMERERLGTPWRTYSGSRYLGGYSDHFPVYAIIESIS